MTIQEAASSIISTLQSAKTTDARSSLNVKIQDIVHQAGGWSEYLATAILSNLERLLRAANSLELELSGVLKKAYDKACEAADEFKDFVKEHPIATEIFCTVIAIGILAVLMPWVLGLLGFGVEGPIEEVVHRSSWEETFPQTTTTTRASSSDQPRKLNQALSESPQLVPPYIPLAFVGRDWHIALVDRTRLARCTIIQGLDWREDTSTRGPCPITETGAFQAQLEALPMGQVPGRTPIYNWMTAEQKLFNGLGISRTDEILHRGGIHLDESASRLGKTTYTDHDATYCARVSARPTSESAFLFSSSITRHFNSSMVHVFRKTEGPESMVMVKFGSLTIISFQEQCLEEQFKVAITATNNKMQANPDRPQMKKIPIYTAGNNVGREALSSTG
ncbi:MAG: acetate non-utilizing protein 9 [Watsoniomyces obsoletus]|nr:MAG: acetate non-utilizing protein 9 [Watsoniomyces obsoletus]